ncbi:hypothetical protein Tco_0991866 [Tanacetum coccineum]|uniref:Uncharacterized protein n=1 Tax=Tanacetum coccineum TaxID=301880 RepID=A0ABQ5F1Z6_9ASTR
MTKKIKKEESDEENFLKKGKKKEKQLTREQAAHEEYLLTFPPFHARITPSFFSAIKNSRVDILRFLTDIGFSSLHNVSIDQLLSKFGWFVVSKFKNYMLSLDTGDKIEVGQFHPVELRDLRVNDIARKLIAAKEIDFLFKVNFLTLFTNTMGKADGLKGKLPSGTNHYLGPLTFLILLYLDSTKYDRFPVVRTRPTIRNWSTYLMKQRQESELKDRMLGLLDLHVEWTEAEMQEAEGFIGSLEISEKEDLIKKTEENLSLIYAERVMLEDYMRKASLKCPGDGKFVSLQEKYVNLFKDPISFNDDGNRDNVGDDDDENGDDDGNVDEDPNGSNPSFGFSKISLEDFSNDMVPAKKHKVVEGNPTDQRTVVEGNQDEECEIMSTPENFTQWLDKNVDLVGEGDLFGDNSATRELMNKGPVTPERMPTQKASPIPQKRVVKPSPYILSPYMNKKTNVVPKITRLEFILGNSVFAMQDVIQSESDEIQSESHVIHFESYVILVESQEIQRESHVIQYLHDSLIFLYSENIFETHSGEYSVYGLRLNMETLAPGLWIDANVIDCWGAILNHEERFRVADSKSRHFFPTGCIIKLMFDGTLATDDAKWDSFSNQVKAQFSGNVDGLALQGIDLFLLVAESGLQLDMLRRLRFKFATKILLHEINVHAQKMLDLAKEFDKLESDENVLIIIHALKNRKESDRI